MELQSYRRATFEKARDKPTLCPLDVSPYNFSASRHLMQRAEESTRKWLDGGGHSRRSRPQELEAHRH
jgi:NTE family protein